MIFGPLNRKHPKIEQIENYLKEIKVYEGKIQEIKSRIDLLLIKLDKEIKELQQKQEKK